MFMNLGLRVIPLLSVMLPELLRNRAHPILSSIEDLKKYLKRQLALDAMDFLFFTGDERCRTELVLVFKVG